MGGSKSVMTVIYMGVLVVLQSQRTLGSSGNGNGNVKAACDVVRDHGYPCEEFQVTTQDGYIITVIRIPRPRGVGGGNWPRPPVLVQHGILLDGISWLLNLREQCLPLVLVDRGFDVWVNNFRGTEYSRRHTTLKTSDSEFWSWSWDELSEYDVPSVLDLIMGKTNQKAHYIGHSMGSLVAMTALSQGRLVDKMKSVALLSPVANLEHVSSPLARAAARAFVGDISLTFGFVEFVPKGRAVRAFLEEICSLNRQLNCYDIIPILTAIRNGGLAKYDYGDPLSNMRHYGSMRPPPYKLSEIPRDFPMFIGHGGNDRLSDPRDVQDLLQSLKSHHREKLLVKYIPDYAHGDFVLGVNAHQLFYHPIADFFHKFN